MTDLSVELEFISNLKNRPLQVDEELATFIQYIKGRKLDNVLEVGAGEGGTTEALSYFVKNLISIDSGNPRFDVVDINSRCKYKYLRGNSHYDESPAEVASMLETQRLDLLFIDGDHSYAGAKLDYLLYMDLVADGGIIAFHDIVESDKHKATGCNVHILWNEIKQTHSDHTEIITNGNWAGIGIIEHKRYGRK